MKDDAVYAFYRESREEFQVSVSQELGRIKAPKCCPTVQK